MADFKYFQVSDSGQCERFNIKKVIKAIVLTFIIIFALFAVMALIITYGDISLSFISITAKIVLYLGAFIAGFFSSFGKKNRGWLSGLVAGIIYMVIVFILGVLLRDNYSFSGTAFVVILIGAVVGAIGGIFGINVKHKRR